MIVASLRHHLKCFPLMPVSDEEKRSLLDGLARDRREEQASLLIGKIVRRWAVIDEWMRSAITDCQMITRHRYSRATRDDPRAPAFFELGNFHPETNQSPRIRKRYLRRLIRELADERLAQEFNALGDEALQLYAVRNELAHAPTTCTPHWEAEAVSARSRELLERSFERFRSALRKRKPDAAPRHVAYTFAELQQFADRLHTLWWDLRDIQNRIPVDGESTGPIAPPRDR